MKTFVNTEQLQEVVAKAARVVTVSHLNPDGDALGSVTAMFHFLRSAGKEVTIVLEKAAVPHNFRWLVPQEAAVACDDSPEAVTAAFESADVVIFMDLNGIVRTGDVQESYQAVAAHRPDLKKVLVDHHLNPCRDEFDIIFSDTEVSSTCELAYSVISGLAESIGAPEKLPVNVAEALLTGILTDTNNFSNSLFPSTYQTVMRLQELGADRDTVYTRVFCDYSVSRMRLMGHLLRDGLHIIPNLGVAYMTLSLEEKKQYDFRKGDSEGFVNLPLAISDVRMSALFTQDEDFIRVSVRSKGDLDVNTFCRRYCNGGGHFNASGGRLYIPIGEVGAYFEKSVAEYLK
ncbi:MAG: DHH family phosphoesterase [Bacteroidales bacterium]|nr:DHH family phosphoesterase [Bacteroidales bacterium]